jgi:hypothetical protein
MLQIVLFTHKNLIYSCLLLKLYRFDLFYTAFSFVLSDGQDLSNSPQEVQPEAEIEEDPEEVQPEPEVEEDPEEV